MARTKGKVEDNSTKMDQKPSRHRATTVESRENQLIALAVDEAERLIRSGQASSQIICHYLKLGSTKERLEKEKLQRENELLVAKVEALQSQKHMEELYEEAMEAFKSYRGTNDV